MAKFRNIDSANDWNFGKGLNDYVSGAEAVKLDVKTRIQSWLGDCFFALFDGIDWINRLEVGQQAQLEQDVRTVILQTPEVSGIIDLAITVTNRNAQLQYNITTNYSQSFQDLIEV